MPRELVAPKSYRTLVGAVENNGVPPDGIYILDTNNSFEFYGLFFMYNGDEAKARFAVEHLRNKFKIYSDIHHRGEIPKPVTFFKELLSDMLREMSHAELRPEGDENFAAALVLEGTIIVGRYNNCPVHSLRKRDNNFRQLFKSGEGRKKLEVASINISDGDRLLFCDQKLVQRITKPELRNILSTRSELDQACGKIVELAARHEEVAEPHILLIKFRRANVKTKAIITGRSISALAAMALFILTVVFWRETMDMFQGLKRLSPARIFSSRQDNAAAPDSPASPLYETEVVFDNLYVPYDVAVDPHGILYIVDDRESEIIRYDPFTRQPTFVSANLNLAFPTGIEISGDRLFITDFGRNALLVAKSTGEKLNVVRNISNPGVGGMRSPRALARDARGDLWLADRGNNRIMKFDFNGRYIGKIEFPGSFKAPNGLACAGSSRVFITFKDTNNIAVISSGAKIRGFTVTYEGKSRGPLTFKQPSGIAVDGKGFVYIADRLNRRIVITDSRGKVDTIIDDKKLKDFEQYMPFGLRIDNQGKYLYIAGSKTTSYDRVVCGKEKGQCRGKIWRMRI